MKLGVFDSGIGGEAVAAALGAYFPEAEMMVVNDKQHVPYGDKSPDEVIRLTDAAIQPLLTADCDVIILACNTATALAITTLRRTYPTQKFIGLEPMLKPAATLTRTGTIAVCATPATLASEAYIALKQRTASDIVTLEPDCKSWAKMIEDDTVNHELIAATVTELCEKGADVIVLGCTHYHWIKDAIIETVAGRATVLEPSEAIGRRVASLLELG